MPKSLQLTESQRGFFRLVAQAAFSNPFGPQRAEADLKLGGATTATPPQERVVLMMKEITERVGGLEAGGMADFRHYQGADHGMLRTSLLFDAFHQFITPIDRHIEAQIKAGEKPVAATFAPELLGLLARRGFDAGEARHALAVFFQLRRAYYFIARSLVGTSPCMLEFKRRLWNNLFTGDMPQYEQLLWRRLEDFSTLLLGETGTGKGAAAAALGRSGYIPFDEAKGTFVESFTRAFVSINLCQYPESLMESELFGHRKGAFTGAIDHHQGVLARCSPHGAIFIDEIGDVGIPVQVKLLQVLQDRAFSPVGGHERLHFHGRVIAATNRPLGELRAQGEFRDDFYYRLCSDVITVPTLRQRFAEDPGELETMLDALVTRLAGSPSPELVRRIHAALMRSPGAAYAWPGNVRELEQAARQILLTGGYHAQASGTTDADSSSLAKAIERGSLDAEQLVAAYCRHLHQRLGTYEAVAKRACLDRRTVKKHITQGPPLPSGEEVG
jgi:DNA-binding NtrC family response regulator